MDLPAALLDHLDRPLLRLHDGLREAVLRRPHRVHFREFRQLGNLWKEFGRCWTEVTYGLSFKQNSAREGRDNKGVNVEEGRKDGPFVALLLVW